MEQYNNNRGGNGYNAQPRNNNVNDNNKGQNNFRPEVVNTCAPQSGSTTLSKVTQHISNNKMAYGVGIGTVLVAGAAAAGYFWLKKSKKKKNPVAQAVPASAPAATDPAPEPASAPAEKSK
jgi:hypothetical protein